MFPHGMLHTYSSILLANFLKAIGNPLANLSEAIASVSAQGLCYVMLIVIMLMKPSLFLLLYIHYIYSCILYILLYFRKISHCGPTPHPEQQGRISNRIKNSSNGFYNPLQITHIFNRFSILFYDICSVCCGLILTLFVNCFSRGFLFFCTLMVVKYSPVYPVYTVPCTHNRTPPRDTVPTAHLVVLY
jgi:hypothetical protein